MSTASVVRKLSHTHSPTMRIDHFTILNVTVAMFLVNGQTWQRAILSIENERLEKRNWLINNFSLIFNQGSYYRSHKDMFKLDRQVVFNIQEEKGTVVIDETS